MLERKLEEEQAAIRLIAQQKIDLENQLEAEQEYLTNKLSKQCPAVGHSLPLAWLSLRNKEARGRECMDTGSSR